MGTIERKRVMRADASQGRRRFGVNGEDGILADAVLVGAETAEDFREVLDEHRARFRRQDQVESALLDDVAVLWWRMRRAQAIETEWLEHELEQEAPGNERARMGGAFGRL